MNTIKTLTGCMLLGLAAQGANAYNYITCSDGSPMFSNDGNPTFRYSNNLFDSEIAQFNTAFSRLTAYSTATITGLDVNDSSYSSGNGQNEIWWTSSVGTADCSYWFIDSPTCDVTEVNIRLGNLTWYSAGEDSNHSPFGSSGRSVLGVAVHEGGHCVGLAHENDEYNIMGDDWTHVTRNGLTTFYGPGESASDGLIDLHGKRSASDLYRDVGVTVMRRTGNSGEYSTHDFGILRNSGGFELPVVASFSGQDVYEVEAGQSIQMEITLENNGEKNSEAPNVGFYRSTDSIISTGDTLLGSQGFTLNRNSVFLYTASVTIPANTASGNYFLGAYIDHDFAIPEQTAANNVGYYPITVVSPDLITINAGASDTTLTPSQSFTASATVQNQGTGDSGTSTLRYYYSWDNVISTGDTQIGTDFIPSLAAAGGQSPESQSVTGPSLLGTFWIGACVDSLSNEANVTNQCTTSPVQVSVAATPSIIEIGASDIQKLQATLNSNINPQGADTTVYIDWGTAPSYGNTITYGPIGSGTSSVSIHHVLSALVCNTPYYYRFRAVNSRGTTLGSGQQFTTLVCGGC